jgi:membrane protease YdiL (CAAX protease family)
MESFYSITKHRSQAGVYIYRSKTLVQSEGSKVTAGATASSVIPKNQRTSAQRDLLELAVGYTLIMATIWTANPTQRVLYWLAFAWIAGTSWARRDQWNFLGLGRKGLLSSLWIVAVALLFSGLAVFIAWRTGNLHPLHGNTPLLLHAGGYIVWALMQQFILQSYFLLRLLRLLPGKAIPVVVATTIFALAHLPNPVLTPITLIWGAISGLLFLRYRNIYALGLAHGIMGLCVAVTVPTHLHRHMRVGLGYLRYYRDHQHDQPLRHLQRSHNDQSVSTEAWVTAEAPTRRS